jgi:hypothetical protein
MPSAFSYRPKFVDIRVKKPSQRKSAAQPPEERPCDHTGCKLAGCHPAPKSRTRTSEFWWFCAEHAGEYNRRWNYFEGMDDGELAAFSREAEIGHRPTWSFKASRNDREAATARGFKPGQGQDAFGVFEAARKKKAAADARKRRFSRLERLALDALALEEDNVTAEAIRTRYAEMVKRYHPDSNGGDRTHEAQLVKAVKAYQVLKQGGHV